MRRRYYRRKKGIAKKEQPFFKEGSPAIQTKEEKQPFFQTKDNDGLTVGQPGDKYEVEADDMADAVMNNAPKSAEIQRKEITGIQRAAEEEEVQTKIQRQAVEEEPVVQTQGAEEEEQVQMKSEDEEVQMQAEEQEVQTKSEEEEVQMQAEEEEVQMQEEEEEVQMQVEEEEVQMKEEEDLQKQEEEEEISPSLQKNAQRKTTADPKLSQRIKQSSGTGHSLAPKTKQKMEGAFGSDFSHISIHTNSDAVQMNKELHSQAFTHGNDIYFNKGKYQPESGTGQHLLAHELTHTIQQKGKIQKKIQKKIGDGHDLSSKQLAGDITLESVFDNERLLRKGNRGAGVSKLQEVLLSMGFRLPNFGADGEFGAETRKAVMEYQVSRGLTMDGLVGPLTIGMLDSELGLVPKGKENLVSIEAPEEIEAGESTSATAKSISGVAEPPVTWKLLQGPTGTQIVDTQSSTTSIVSPNEGFITIAAMKSPPVTKTMKAKKRSPKVCKYTFSELNASKASNGKAATVSGSSSRLLLWFDFEPGKSKIRSNHTAAVKKLIQIDRLDQKIPQSEINFILGFSDCVGKEAKNLQVRIKRADELKDEFINLGALKKNIGTTFPSHPGSELGNNFTAEGRARNRSALVISKPVKPPKPEKIKIEDIIERLKKIAKTIKIDEQRKRIICLLDMILDKSKDDHYINGFDHLIRVFAKGKFPRLSAKNFAKFIINNSARRDMTKSIFTKGNDELVKKNLKQLDVRILKGINLVFDQRTRNEQLNFNNPVLRQMHEFISAQQRNKDSIYFCYGKGQK